MSVTGRTTFAELAVLLKKLPDARLELSFQKKGSRGGPWCAEIISSNGGITTVYSSTLALAVSDCYDEHTIAVRQTKPSDKGVAFDKRPGL